MIWIGGRSPDGYGKFMTGRHRDQKVHRAHRWIYERLVGPAGAVLRHKCDVPLCVEVSHLEPGTQKDNIYDSIKKGRHSVAKLDEDKARTIRRLRAEGVRVVDIAARYEVGVVAVYDVLKGRTWS